MVSCGEAICPRQWQFDADIPRAQLPSEWNRQTDGQTDELNYSIALCSPAVYAGGIICSAYRPMHNGSARNVTYLALST